MSMPIELATLVAGWLLGEITPLNYVWSYYRNKEPLMRLLDPFVKKDEDCIIVLPRLPLQKDQLKSEYPFIKKIGDKEIPLHWTTELTGIHDSIAVSHIHALLSLAGKKEVRIKSDEALEEDEWNVNLICIGAWSNRITMATLERSAPYFKFGTDDKGGYISSPKTEKWYYDEINNRNYGILLKLKDVFQSGKAVIVAAGLGPDATAGAAYYLSTRWRELSKKYSASPFGILVKIDTNLGYGSAEAIDQWPPAK